MGKKKEEEQENTTIGGAGGSWTVRPLTAASRLRDGGGVVELGKF